MKIKCERTEEEIDALIEKVNEYTYKGDSKFRGMTYEQGIRAAIDWMLDKEETDPME